MVNVLKNDLICIKKIYDNIFIIVNDNIPYDISSEIIFKDSISTTKIRVVFDASARTANNKSLNVLLLKGPTLQGKLFNLLIRFRFPTYAMGRY